jgi:hypothetical protein
MLYACLEQFTCINMMKTPGLGLPPYGDVTFTNAATIGGEKILDGVYRPVTPEFLGYMQARIASAKKKAPFPPDVERAERFVALLIEQSELTPIEPPPAYMRPVPFNFTWE